VKLLHDSFDQPRIEGVVDDADAIDGHRDVDWRERGGGGFWRDWTVDLHEQLPG
jgi:hypothetical protein